ncbi:hypothetical protein BB561_004377 [Smittium simulii]|uniref:Gluconokinase n=1 Tax=Smittium simulii TaxID=133385 RepID=A0A2T9YGM0_9FUNG|nr:hypothetical protein BB561_004377 [Smittium simulii]
MLKLIVLMGVCGAGKTTIGLELASKLSAVFLDADHFHTTEAKLKMTKGIPLSDSDRFPWLHNIKAHIISLFQANFSPKYNDSTICSPSHNLIILACSALKLSYRAILTCDIEPQIYLKSSTSLLFYHTDFALLTCSTRTLIHRLKARTNHFVNDLLVESQLATLKTDSSEPNLFVFSTENNSITHVVSEIILKLSLAP